MKKNESVARPPGLKWEKFLTVCASGKFLTVCASGKLPDVDVMYGPD